MRLQLLYEFDGRVDTREVLRPNAQGPRMRINCSGTLRGSGRLAMFEGAMSFGFVANPRATGAYRWKSRGIGFGPHGPAFTWRGIGSGQRSRDGFIYRGGALLQAVLPEFSGLDALACAFEYRQQADGSHVHLACHVLGDAAA